MTLQRESRVRTLAARQVHLDFHTSEHIPGVGTRFSKAQFQEALTLGHVNSITLFAKCHHSWSYYPTQLGQMHPALSFDLLGAQIEACHEIGVRAPIYYTVGWSANDAEAHPEWWSYYPSGDPVIWNIDRDATPEKPLPPVSWILLCPSGTYVDQMLAEVREICERYPVDGLFYDICFFYDCCCPNCVAGMQAQGIDPQDEAGRHAYNAQKWDGFMQACRAIIQERHPEATVFFNGSAGMKTPVSVLENQTHFELEDLPTTWGGYDKFPLRSKYFHTMGKAMLGMSGKFHTSWGEFGGYKHPDAIRFEAASMIAFGASCSFGDQLHPCGEMDLETYRNIGAGYAYVEQIEAYGLGGRPCANLGLYIDGDTPDAQGVANMLFEHQIDFEVVTATSDLDKYETIILTGARYVDEAEAARLQAYVDAGGSLLIMGDSALHPERDTLMFDVGGMYVGTGQFDVDYLAVGAALADGVVRSPILCYTPAARIAPTDGEVLAAIYEPYFSRTHGKFCSHMNTPPQPEPAAHVGGLQKGRIIYLPHAFGRLYHDHGARMHREIVINALRRLYTQQTLTVELPSVGRVNLLHQPEARRYVAHLLYAPPLQRGRCLVIEDMVPLYNIPVTLRVPETIATVSLPLDGETLPTAQDGGAVSVTVPKLAGHQVVVFGY